MNFRTNAWRLALAWALAILVIAAALTPAAAAADSAPAGSAEITVVSDADLAGELGILQGEGSGLTAEYMKNGRKRSWMARSGGMRGKTDAELMELVLAKHRPALEEMYDRYVKLVYSFAVKATRDEQRSREIVQLVFTRLWTTRTGYDPAKGLFVNWLLTVTRNLTVDLLRQERKRGAAVSVDASVWEQLPAPQDDSPEAVVALQVTREEIREVYKNLCESQIRLIDCVYWQGYTLSEAAAFTGEPLGTIKSRLHHTLKLLRKSWRNRGRDNTCKNRIRAFAANFWII